MRKSLSNIGFMFKFAWKRCKSYYFVMFFKNIFSAALPFVRIVGLGSVVDSLVNQQPFENTVRIIAIFLLINFGLSVIDNILGIIDFYILRIDSDKSQFEWVEDSLNIDYHYLQDGSFETLRRQSMFFSSNTIYFAGEIFKNMIQFTGVIYIVSVFSPLFLIIFLLTSLISIFLTFKQRKNDFNLSNERVDGDRKLEYLYNAMSDYKFAKEVRINNASEYLGEKYENIFEKQIQKLKAFYGKAVRINLLNTVVTIIQTVAMYFYFSWQYYNGQITIAEYTVLLGTATLFASVMLWIFDSIAQIKNFSARVNLYRQYRELMDNNCIISNSSKLDGLNIDFKDAAVKFDNVSFIYPNSEKTVLKNISVEIKKGERLGIVGLNGSGKTTFVKLLARIYDPTDGTVSIGGVDIRNIPYKKYSENIGIVLQDFMLFAYSVKENIAFDREFDEEKIFGSIEKSGLKEKIDGLKNGIETSVYKELDDDGVEFSGGEGQKLALARAVYKAAEILILDEPTSALDPVAEYDLFSRLNDIAQDKTTIFISHRLSSTKFCDRILVFDNGEIVETGNHDELMQINGIYADLFNSQAQYYKIQEGNKV